MTNQAAPSTAPATKPARILLNPQPKIDAAQALLAEAGGSLMWKNRVWTATLDGKSVVMDSREFSTLSPEALLIVLQGADAETA